jgi:CheY-like chemotaxis protein
MDDATRARVFEPFFTTKEVGRGTGLGLATAYAIVSDHGGRISCQSRVGEGATFEIELPGVATSLDAPAPASVRPSPARGGETILLIDDDDLVRRATRTTLLRNGYRVLESRDGDEALALLAARRETIDLVVLDRSMPGRSGEAILAELRALAPEVLVLLLSGQPFAAESVFRANAALIKPVRTDELLGEVRNLLDR